jgi:hypothetical protein
MRITESSLRQIIRSVLRERNIGSVYGDVTVKVSVDLTRHADDRRFRHGRGQEIEEEEIVATAEAATDRVIDYLINDRMDVGDEFVIRDLTYDLNLVGVIEPTGDPDVLEMTVITVMRKRGFKPKPGTVAIDIK